MDMFFNRSYYTHSNGWLSLNDSIPRIHVRQFFWLYIRWKMATWRTGNGWVNIPYKERLGNYSVVACSWAFFIPALPAMFDMCNMLDYWGLCIYYTGWSICWKFTIGKSVFVFCLRAVEKDEFSTIHIGSMGPENLPKTNVGIDTSPMDPPSDINKCVLNLAKWHGSYGICTSMGLPISSGSAKTGGCNRNNQTGEEICALSDVPESVGFKTMFGNYDGFIKAMCFLTNIASGNCWSTVVQYFMSS